MFIFNYLNTSNQLILVNSSYNSNYNRLTVIYNRPQLFNKKYYLFVSCKMLKCMEIKLICLTITTQVNTEIKNMT